MAIAHGALCMRCEQEEARPDSHFCSKECRDAHMAESDGPVTCAHCSNDAETATEAKAAGWEDVEEDAEGCWWNYIGVCPECKTKEEYR